MTDHTPGQSETDPLAALRQLVARMTGLKWCTGVRKQTSDYGDAVLCVLDERSLAVAADVETDDAAAIVAGSRALRLLADEATVEGVARALDPLAFDETRAGYHVWKGKRNATMQKAQLVIAHLAAQIVKEPQP